jgi:hypothetical protein
MTVFFYARTLQISDTATALRRALERESLASAKVCFPCSSTSFAGVCSI